jgi:hypothetical protein
MKINVKASDIILTNSFLLEAFFMAMIMGNMIIET